MIGLNQVTVGTVATLVQAQVEAQGATIVFVNGSASDPVYLGLGTAVTVTNGAVLAPYGSVTLQNVTSAKPVYAVAGTTVTLGVFYGDTQGG